MEKIVIAVNRALVGRTEEVKVKAGEIYPTDIAPVCANTADGIVMTAMKWGFPGFPKPGSKAKPPVIINARSETVSQKPTFSKYLSQRCLVPASRYFEWVQNVKTSDGKKPKYEFTPKDNEMLLFWMAAIYRQVEGEGLPVFTILTKEASASVAPIHNRMPIIWRDREAQIAWVKGNGNIEELIHEGSVKEIEYQAAAV
jgi:putative SOS response-associated peptidase YedK